MTLGGGLLADVELPTELVEFHPCPSQTRTPTGIALILGRVDDQALATFRNW